MNRIGNFASILGLIITIIQLITEDMSNYVNLVIIFLFFIILVTFWVQHNSVKHYADAHKKLQDIYYEIGDGVTMFAIGKVTTDR